MARGDELVLWDATGGVGERRDIPPTLDDATAAALALSIKTWMHLGAPPSDDPPDGPDGPDGSLFDVAIPDFH